MISFFAKNPYFLEDEKGLFPKRLSSVIRAQQMAKYLNAKINPTHGYEDDVCIWIKPVSLNPVRDGDYVDILDDPKGVLRLKERPLVNVIAMNSPHAEWLQTILHNKVFIIRHQHMNFENIKRDREEVTVCGYVGANNSYHKGINAEVGKRLKEEGFEFICLLNFEGRQDIINFYKNIDIQVIGYFDFHVNVPYYHEKKIVDAMSFGIPTVAGPKLGYLDVDDYYIHAHNMEELLREVKRLREEPEYYKNWSEKILKKADEYHISNIAKSYQTLK